MANHTDLKTEQVAATQPPLSGSQPIAALKPWANVVLVDSTQATPCHFWFGVTTPGDNVIDENFNWSMADAVLRDASKHGVLGGDQPILLTDTSSGLAKYLYLLPAIDSSSNGTAHASDASWIQKVKDALNNWNPDSLGLYFDAKNNKHCDTEIMLLGVLREHLRQDSQSGAKSGLTIYVLHEETQYLNCLNRLLALKQSLGQQASDVRVFH